ncbi:MAG: 7-carboxy-7-deazaguanine synthase [Owenweeksia sp. TMED14]|nr:MAG: 7-carboxy-7-deazaguanine synthase [Owenweeksia sp. TMED14]
MIENSKKPLPLMEAFRTIQGEGAHTGVPSFFFRIGGCDVGCHWCDVKESWDAGKHALTDVSVMLKMLEDQDLTVVITGGEPLMWNMSLLTESLKKKNKKIHLETSGAYKFSGTWDWICLSPKKTKSPLEEWYEKADELKMIIYNLNDLKWAEKHAAKVGPNCQVFLQPEWSKRDLMLPVIIEYLEKKSNWRLSLQTHKYIGLP